jgi:Glycine transporter
LSYAAGNAGGIARDLLIGAVPPAAISDWRYLAVSLDHAKWTVWRDKGCGPYRGMPVKLRGIMPWIGEEVAAFP